MKQFKHMILAGTISTLLAGAAVASEVTSVTTFSAGTPAVASQVNANFSALIAAINDNNSRIAALEAAAPTDSVSGRSYLLRDMGWIMAAERADDSEAMPTGAAMVQGGFSRVGFYHGELTLVLAANSSFTITGADYDVEMFTNPDSEIGSETNPVSETGTWVQNGNDLTLTFTGGVEIINLTVSKGGHVLSNGGGSLRDSYLNNTNYLYEYEGSLMIGVEVDPAP